MHFNKKNHPDTKVGSAKRRRGRLLPRGGFRRTALIVIALVMAVSTLSSLFSPGTANAASTSKIEDNGPTVQSESWAYLNAVTDCLRDNTRSNSTAGLVPSQEITPADAASGNW
jgi:hypothetical protein